MDPLIDANFVMSPLYWTKGKDHLRLLSYPHDEMIPNINTSLVIWDYRWNSVKSSDVGISEDEKAQAIQKPAHVITHIDVGPSGAMICSIQLRNPRNRDKLPESLFSVILWQKPFTIKELSETEKHLWLCRIEGSSENNEYVVLAALTNKEKRIEIVQEDKLITISDWITPRPFLPVNC